MTKKQWWTAASVAGVMALGLGLAWSPAGNKVETARVTRSALSVTVDEEGRTRVRDRYVIAAPVSGRVERITTLEGRRLAAGELVARVFATPQDPRTAEMARGALAAASARRLEALTGIETARARREQTARDLVRALAMFKGGAGSQDAAEQAKLADLTAEREIEVRRSAFDAADAEVASARAALIGMSPGAASGPTVEVRAPTAGRVLRVLQQSARVVEAGTPLIEIDSASGIEAVVDVLSEEAVRVKTGDPVIIDHWGGETPLQGRVRLVEPEGFTKVSALGVEEQRVNVVVDLEAPPPSLGARYRFEAHIVTWSGESVLTAPMSSLFRNDREWSAFAVVNGRAERRIVRIGHQSTDSAEVLGGLSEADLVILYPSPLIFDGVRVR